MIKELEYDLTKEDLNKYYKDYLKTKQIKKIRFMLTLVVTIIPFIIDIPAIITNNKTVDIYYISFFVLYFLLIYFIFPLLHKIDFQIANRGTDFSNNKLIINSDNSYINLEDKNYNEERKWSSFKYIYNLEYNFLLFISNTRSLIIPKRIFESEQEMNETWELIQECYNKNQNREELK